MRALAIVLVLFLASAAEAQTVLNPQPFGLWVEELKAEALARGVSGALFDAAFNNLAPSAQVIAHDAAQPESTLTQDEYVRRVVTQGKIRKGRAAYQANSALLNRVSAAYGVPAPYIVALWGIESDFGEHMGHFNIIEALATLAYDGRRSAFFRGELLDALLILQQERLTPDALQGSWAGAMGQCQFMPSSYLRYAVDFDGGGRRDIWNDQADVFASIANYLASEGWQAGRDNTPVLLKWNRSHYFAAAVHLLAADIAERNG